MIGQEDILITKIKTKIKKDLNKPNSIYHLNERFEIAGIEFFVDEKSVSKNEDINLVLNKYVYNKIEEQLPNSKIWLVVTSWVEDNKLSQYKIAQHKKFWNASIISKSEADTFSFVSNDVVVDIINNKLILSTLFQVNKTSFDCGIKALKTNSAVKMFISSNEDFTSRDNIKNIYNSFDNSYPPLKGLKYFEEDIFVRTGVIEEFCVPFIDFFLSPSKLLEMNLGNK